MSAQSPESTSEPSVKGVPLSFDLLRPLVISNLAVIETLSEALTEVFQVKQARFGHDLAEAQLLLEREGYNISTVFIDGAMFGWERSAQWIFNLREDFPWLIFVLLVDDKAFVDKFKGVERLEHYFSLPLARSKKEILEEMYGQAETWLNVMGAYSNPPLPPVRSQYLTQSAGILFSVCHTGGPWEIDADAMVVPMGTPFTTSTLADRLMSAMSIDSLSPETTDGRKLAVIEAGNVYELNLPQAPTRPKLLFTTARDSNNTHKLDRAIASARAAIDWAVAKEDCQTLILPTLGCGKGGLDAGQFVRGLINGLGSEFLRGGLRHVVLTDNSESNIAAILSQAGAISQVEVGRADRMHNDEPTGEDQLGVKGQLEALADAIALREMKPPLVVGILGGWGAGKSFAMRIIEQRLKWIRGLQVPDQQQDPQGFADFPYIGHPYIVRFDSWTYAKSELWASLMQRILQELDEQLSLEQMLHDSGVDAREGVDLWQLMSRLDKTERSAFDNLLDSKHLDKFLALKDEGDTQALWEVLKKARSEENSALKNAEHELSEKRDELDQTLADKALALNEHRHAMSVYREQTLSEETAKAEIAVKKIESEKNTKLQVLHNNWEEQRKRVRQTLEQAQKRLSVEQGEADEMAAQFKQRLHEKTEEHRQQIEREHSAAAWVPVKNLAIKLLGDSMDDVFKKVAKQAGDKPLSIDKIRKEVSTFQRVKQGWHGYSWALLGFSILACASPWLLALIGVKISELLPVLSAILTLIGSVYSGINNFTESALELEKAYQEELKQVQQASEDTLEDRVNQELFEERETLAKRLLELDEQRRRAQMIADDALDEAQVKLQQNITQLREASTAEIEAIRKQALSKANRLSEQFQSNAIKRLQVLERAFSEAVSERDKVVEELESQVNYHRQRAGITVRSKSLLEFVSQRNSDGYYDKQLGVIHQVQKDLEEITDALLPVSLEEKQGEAAPPGRFVRGEPRIILLVDDLDRCPPETVVKMLEAAQLLVKTRLFVVVLAMDIRYVTRALEHEYKGILVRDGDPSGLDYIEKIVQVPYRVPSIDPAFMQSFLGKQMTMAKPVSVNPSKQSEQQPQTNKPLNIRPDSAANKTNGKKLFFQVPETSLSDVIPVSTLTIDAIELELLTEACNAVRITPRAATRLTNVYKLLKIIWHKANVKIAPEIRKMVSLLLALSSRFPEIMRKLLQDLDNEFHAANEVSLQTTIQTFMLLKLDEETLQQASPQELVEVRAILSNKNNIATDLKLIELGHDNLRLALSFCFTPEASHEPNHQHHSN